MSRRSRGAGFDEEVASSLAARARIRVNLDMLNSGRWVNDDREYRRTSAIVDRPKLPDSRLLTHSFTSVFSATWVETRTGLSPRIAVDRFLFSFEREPPLDLTMPASLGGTG